MVKIENGTAGGLLRSLKKTNSSTSTGSNVSKKSFIEGATQQNIQADDTSNTTLYVSRLHHKLGYKQFNMHFAEFGKVTKCYLSETGREHHNKGFGFVTYDTEQDMKKALEAQHELKGHVAVVQINQPKSIALEKVSKKRMHQDDTSAGPPSKKMCQHIKHEIYVGGLPEDTSDEQIKKHFSHFGEVANVFVPKKLDSRSLKYVFVGFKEASSLQAALEAKEHRINKTQALLRLKKDGKNVDMPVGGKVSSGVLRNADPEAHKRTLFVGQLDYTSKATAVQEHFSKYGKVTGLTMPRHPRKGGQNKGFALIEFDTTVAFQKAFRAKKHKVDGKVLKVIQSEEPKNKKEKKKVNAVTEVHELFVADIPSSINNKALTVHFSRYGKLVAVNRPMRQHQRKVRNYAFVQYQTKEGLAAALADNNHKIAGEPLVVRKSKGENLKKEKTADNEMLGVEEKEEEEDEDEDEDEGEDEDEDV